MWQKKHSAYKKVFLSSYSERHRYSQDIVALLFQQEPRTEIFWNNFRIENVCIGMKNQRIFL